MYKINRNSFILRSPKRSQNNLWKIYKFFGQTKPNFLKCTVVCSTFVFSSCQFVILQFFSRVIQMWKNNSILTLKQWSVCDIVISFLVDIFLFLNAFFKQRCVYAVNFINLLRTQFLYKILAPKISTQNPAFVRNFVDKICAFVQKTCL